MLSYRNIITVVGFVLLPLLSGCAFIDNWVYRPDINQGNYVTEDAVDKLKIGQTKEQVVYIMGTPMLTSIFGDNVWYYVFRQQPQYRSITQTTYTLSFDAQGVLVDIKNSVNFASK